MKRFIYLVAVLIAAIGQTNAQVISVEDVTIPQGEQQQIQVLYSLDKANAYVAGGFNLILPEGISTVKDANGTAIYQLDESNNQFHVEVTTNDGFGFYNTKGITLSGTTGTLMTLTLQADASLAVGSTHVVGVSNAMLSDGTSVPLADATFTVTIAEPTDKHIILDETSTTAPTAATGVDVRVYRTINANEWSTICLPFAMSEAKVKAAFGDDVQIGDFTGYEVTKDGGNITGIEMKFDNSITAIEANHPYIIKVSMPINEFTVDGVTIDPVDEPSVEQDNGKTGRNRVVYSGFYGTYTAGISLAEMAENDFLLFLSGNKLWYATSATQSMKAFRGYFWLTDVLSEVESSTSRIIMSFSDNNTTGITNIYGEADSRYYNLQGLPVETPVKGMYIRNGKVVIVK